MWKPGKALNLSVSNRKTIPAEIADCKGLKALYISRTKVSDLNPLAKLENLEELYLLNTKVSDINTLENLTRLKVLSLSETSAAQNPENAKIIKKLRDQGCRILRWKSTT